MFSQNKLLKLTVKYLDLPWKNVPRACVCMHKSGTGCQAWLSKAVKKVLYKSCVLEIVWWYLRLCKYAWSYWCKSDRWDHRERRPNPLAGYPLCPERQLPSWHCVSKQNEDSCHKCQTSGQCVRIDLHLNCLESRSYWGRGWWYCTKSKKKTGTLVRTYSQVEVQYSITTQNFSTP